MVKHSKNISKNFVTKVSEILRESRYIKVCQSDSSSALSQTKKGRK
ncbi:hypothetical protein [Facklamia hominis]